MIYNINNYSQNGVSALSSLDQDSPRAIQITVDNNAITLDTAVIKIINSMNEHYKHTLKDYFKLEDKTANYKRIIEKLRIGFYKDLLKVEGYSYELETKLKGIHDLE